MRREKPFDVLIHGILSARTRDEVTFPAQERLFKIANTTEKILKLPAKRIEKLIYPVGFYKTKARRLKEACKFLLEEFRGKVPDSRKELMKIPGVGGKIADIVLLFAFGRGVIPVDSHVLWVANQLKWTGSKNPERVREDLHRIIPENLRPAINQLLVEHGRQVCVTGRPKCEICPIEKYCPGSRLNHQSI